MKWHTGFPEQATQKSSDFGRKDEQKRTCGYDLRRNSEEFSTNCKITQVNKIQCKFILQLQGKKTC